MVELAFVACLIASPDACQPRSLVYANITPTACLFGAQPELAKWVAAHPKYRIKSFKSSYINCAEKEA